MTAPVLVTGATGNVGGATARALIGAGIPVRVAGTDPSALHRRFPGAEVAVLTFTDPATFDPAARGAGGLFLLRPPPISRVGPTLNALVDVAAGNGVRHVVFAPAPRTSGPHPRAVRPRAPGGVDGARADTVRVVTPQRPPGADAHDPRVTRSRAAVLAATLELLADRGIAGTTIEAVAQRSGVAKTTIYRQWPGQAELVLDTLTGLLQPPVDPDTGTLRGDLLDLVTGLARSVSRGPAAALMFALVDAAERDPAFAALHRREAAARHAVILAVISRGIRRGELPSDTDPADVLDLIAGPIFHRRAVSGGTIDAAFATRVVDRVLAAYRGATARS